MDKERRLAPYDPIKMSLRKILASDQSWKSGWNDMDEIHPGLFLGGVDAAKDTEKLKKAGVTHVVNCSFTHKPIFSPLGVGTNEEFYNSRGMACQFLGLPAVDISGFKISQYFNTSAEFIHSAIENKGKVLVHCFMGVSRSSTLVLAYLMMKQKMEAPDALKLVRSKRNVVHPNEGFLEQICQLHRRLFEPEPAPGPSEHYKNIVITDEDGNTKES